MQSKVSIIVPNYNHQIFLEERLDSIFNQTFQDFEVLIFDDASTDASIEVLKKYKNYSNVSHFIVNKKNSGSPFKQWKKGMQLAKSEYIWIAETDDYADLNFLEEQMKLIINCDVVIAKTISIEGLHRLENEVFHPIFKKSSTNVILNGDMFLSSPIKNVSCIVFKKPTIFELEKMIFDQFSSMGDQVFYFEFFKNKCISFNPNTKSYFRRVSTSVSNLNKDINYFEQYFTQHLRFIKLISSHFTPKMNKEYVIKHYNKVKNRTSLKHRFNHKYLFILIRYYTRLWFS